MNTSAINRAHVAATRGSRRPSPAMFTQSVAMQECMVGLEAGARDGRVGWETFYATYVAAPEELRRAMAVYNAVEHASWHRTEGDFKTRDGATEVSPTARTMMTAAHQIASGCAHTGQFATRMAEYADRLESRKMYAPAALCLYLVTCAMQLGRILDDTSTRENTARAWEFATQDNVQRALDSALWAALSNSQHEYMTPAEHRWRRKMNKSRG